LIQFAAAMADVLQLGNKVNCRLNGLDGTIRFLGATHFAPGAWVGLELGWLGIR